MLHTNISQSHTHTHSQPHLHLPFSHYIVFRVFLLKRLPLHRSDLLLLVVQFKKMTSVLFLHELKRKNYNAWWSVKLLTIACVLIFVIFSYTLLQHFNTNNDNYLNHKDTSYSSRFTLLSSNTTSVGSPTTTRSALDQWMMTDINIKDNQIDAYFLSINASDSCNLYSVPFNLTCEYIWWNGSNCSTTNNYLNLQYCTTLVHAQPVYYILVVIFIIIYLYLLGDTAEQYFSGSLLKISQYLKMSPNFAGVTILALGNGAPVSTRELMMMMILS